MTRLMDEFKHFWYATNRPEFVFEDNIISKYTVVAHGGPDPSFDCPICQQCEFLSRVNQRDIFIKHSCQTASRCEDLCSKQGDDRWTNLHRNHFFSVGYDSALPVPKILFFLSKEESARLWQIFHARTCEYHMHNLRAQLAIVGEVTVCNQLVEHDWGKYDFLFAMNTGNSLPVVERPPIPVVLYCHDLWGQGFQERLTHYQPEYIMTPYPTPWYERYDIPENTKLWFYPPLAGMFYTRPNLKGKDLDLLVVGTTAAKFYTPRREYKKQLESLTQKYEIEFSDSVGCMSHNTNGPVIQNDNGRVVRYMNKWSEYLGTARFVTFGPCIKPWASEFLLMKYGECVGSGAIPIIPTVKDLDRLGIQPMVHYIPLENVWNNNGQLCHYLDNYESYKYIAENGVAWYRKNADALIYPGFAAVAEELTSRRCA